MERNCYGDLFHCWAVISKSVQTLVLFQSPLQSMPRQGLSFDKSEEQFDGLPGINLMVLDKVSGVSGDKCLDCRGRSYPALHDQTYCPITWAVQILAGEALWWGILEHPSGTSQ